MHCVGRALPLVAAHLAFALSCGGSFQRVAKPKISVTPEAYRFGFPPPGTVETVTLHVQNRGAAPLTVRRARLSGASSVLFSIDSPPALPMTLAPVRSLEIHVSYRPENRILGIEPKATLSIESDDPERPNVDVALTAERGGRFCTVTLSPERLDFGTVPLGTDATLPVTILNAGSGDCEVLSTKILVGEAYFTQARKPDPGTRLAGGGSTSVDITFRPFQAGSAVGILQVRTRDPTDFSSETGKSVDLAGIGR